MAIALAQYGVLLLAYALMAADRSLFSVLAPNIRKEFAFSLARTGVLSTIFAAGLAIGGLPTGYLLSISSRKAVLTSGVTVFSAATALIASATGFWPMLVCLGFQGIGMSMMATPMFSLAASYFSQHRAAAIGSVNFSYGLGGFGGPIVAGMLLASGNSWRFPVIVFGSIGFLMALLIALSVQLSFSETRGIENTTRHAGGASTLLNRNTILLALLSAVQGFIFYGFLGLYPTFLRESLGYTPKVAGFIVGFYGLGAFASVAGGWLGDRFSPRLVISSAFLLTAMIGMVLFGPRGSIIVREILTLLFGVIGSSVLYVNLAAYHVKSVQRQLVSRASGTFVTSLYGAASLAGLFNGFLASHLGWARAGEIQISGLAVAAAIVALRLAPAQITENATHE